MPCCCHHSAEKPHSYDQYNTGGHIPLTCRFACRSLYPRFYEAFASAGETSMPVDATLLRSDAFYELLARLRLHAAQHDSEHW